MYHRIIELDDLCYARNGVLCGMYIIGKSTIRILNNSYHDWNRVGQNLGKGISTVLSKHSHTIRSCLSKFSVRTFQISVEKRNKNVLVLDTFDSTKFNNVIDYTESPLLICNRSIRSLENKLNYLNEITTTRLNTHS